MDIDKRLILKRLKEYKNIHTDAKFARFLNITPQNLAKWYERNTFDIDKVVNVFPEVNKVWLLSGIGEMLQIPSLSPPPANCFSEYTDEQIEEILTDRMAKHLLNMYEEGRAYPASVVDKMLADKDLIILKLQQDKWRLEEQIKRVDPESKAVSIEKTQ